MAIRELLEYCLETDDPEAWNEFVHRIEPTIAGVIFNTLRRFGQPQPDLVQDLVQQIHIKLFANERKVLRDFRWPHDDAIYGFMKVVARRMVIDYFRKTKPDVPLEEAVNTAVDSRFSEDLMQRPIQIVEIEQSLDAIESPSRDKDVFWFYFRYGYTAKAISELPAISLTEKKIENILARLIRQVKAHIKHKQGRSRSEGF